MYRFGMKTKHWDKETTWAWDWGLLIIMRDILLLGCNDAVVYKRPYKKRLNN
jgi:hypothetical protein